MTDEEYEKKYQDALVDQIGLGVYLAEQMRE